MPCVFGTLDLYSLALVVSAAGGTHGAINSSKSSWKGEGGKRDPRAWAAT